MVVLSVSNNVYDENTVNFFCLSYNIHFLRIKLIKKADDKEEKKLQNIINCLVLSSN